MSQPPSHRLEAVDWYSVLPWLRLCCFHMAVRPSRLALSFALLLTLHLIGAIAASLGERSESTGSALDDPSYHLIHWVAGWAPRWAWEMHGWRWIAWVAAAAIVTPFFAGAITRSAAVEAARDRTISLGAARDFALRRFPALFFTPLLPHLIAVLIGLLALTVLFGMVLLGIPFLNYIGAVLFGLTLPVGLLLALVMLGGLAALPLIYPALAVEQADPLEALSRAYNYTLGKLWRVVLHTLVMFAYGLITLLFVRALVSAAILLIALFTAGGLGLWDRTAARELLSLAIDLPPRDPRELEFSQSVIAQWFELARLIPAAYGLSYFLCAQTWSYLLLRRVCDGAELDEIEAADAPDAPDTPDTPDDTRHEAGGGS